MILANKIKQK